MRNEMENTNALKKLRIEYTIGGTGPPALNPLRLAFLSPSRSAARRCYLLASSMKFLHGGESEMPNRWGKWSTKSRQNPSRRRNGRSRSNGTCTVLPDGARCRAGSRTHSLAQSRKVRAPWTSLAKIRARRQNMFQP